LATVTESDIRKDLERKLRLVRKQRALLEKQRWRPRGYQVPSWEYLKAGGKRAVMVWHRRAGKDTVALHWTVEAAMARVGVYWHMLPTSVQGRKVVWDGRTKDGKRFLDAWGPEAGQPGSKIWKIRHDEMSITLKHPEDDSKPGSIWQVVGSDNYDALVGSNPVGVVFSEYSVADPRAWDFIRPILAENGGWAIFPYTPRGHNHGLSLYEMALNNPDWYCERLSVEDTGAIPLSAVEDERAAGMSEDMIQQEFYCSFEASLVGAYYADQMAKALEENRLGNVPHEPGVAVHTFWDLGVGDATAIGFVQYVGKERRVIDYYETNGEALSHYAGVLQSKAQEKNYVYGTHYLPHDAVHRELGTGKTRQQTLAELGIVTQVVPMARFEAGVDAVRNMFPSLWIDKSCDRLINALRNYRKELDEVRGIYKEKPVHDWTSHGADMVRYMALTSPTKSNWGRKIEHRQLAIV
jgi:phage terminase large subunit